MQKAGYKGQKSVNIQKLLSDTQSKPNAVVSIYNNIIQIELPDDMALYFFTQPQHLAHPAVIIRQIVTENNMINVKTEGYTNGDQLLFEQWLQDFTNQDTTIKKEFN